MLRPLQSKPSTFWRLRGRRQDVPHRFKGPYPDPPTLEQWRAPPMEGTEEILRAALKKRRMRSGYDPRESVKKKGKIPWILDVDFATNEEIWCFVDDMDLAELRRQRVKFGLKNENDAFEMKKALFLLVKHQEYYQKEADEIMERRIHKANVRAERRAVMRRRSHLNLEPRKDMEDDRDLLDLEVGVSWAFLEDVEVLGE